MSDQVRQIDPSVIGNLRDMARQGRSPSELVRELQRRLGPETHIVTLLNYFRQAFALTLTDVKPVSALSRNEQREVENEALLDEVLSPAILKRRPDWDGHKQ